ncbi:MAG TPA: stage V sporulation protein K, partial [Phaeodactylibacter sp.]|nr:stage V sporulation protein K [Phaeodactylibacter sp.]
MSKEKDKKTALGGNFKLKGIKVFASKENLYRNTKKYRKVFDVSECRYIYCELSLYNKLFDEADWNANIVFQCKEKNTGTPLCEIKKELLIPQDKNIVYINEGWGTPELGWWKKGMYYWEVSIDGEVIGSTDFFIVDGGQVTADNNPYFDIKEIRLFESDKKGLPPNERIYL